MAVLIGFFIGNLTCWIALRMIRWGNEPEVKETKEERKIE
jgi:hypothetical protein